MKFLVSLKSNCLTVIRTTLHTQVSIEIWIYRSFSLDDEEFHSIFGVKGTKNISHLGFIHIGCKSEYAGNSWNRNIGDFSVDSACESQLLFVNIDIIENQTVGDVRAQKNFLSLKDVWETLQQPGRIRKQNCQTNSFHWHPKSHRQFKISKNVWHGGIPQQSSISINTAFFRTLQTKRLRPWSPCCRN